MGTDTWSDRFSPRGDGSSLSRVSSARCAGSYCEGMTTISPATESPIDPDSRPQKPIPWRWFTVLAIAWLAVYMVVRLAVAAADDLPPMSTGGSDLIVLAGPSGNIVLGFGLLAVALQAGFVRRRANSAHPLLRILVAAVGSAAAGALMVASCLILLDLVAAILPGLGVVFHPLGALLRLGCVVSGVLIAVHSRHFWTATRTTRPSRARPTTTPRWVVAFAYLAVAACTARLVAQLVVGLEMNPLTHGPAMIVFETGFLLAGIVLPLALVHTWGRIWPPWVPGLRGRRVPRWPLVVSGSLLGVTMASYFGTATVQMIIDRLQGRSPFPPAGGVELPEAFFWVSVPAYLVWGIGLVVTTFSYARLTSAEPRRLSR